MVDRKKPRNKAVGPNVVPRVIGDPKSTRDDGSTTFARGGMTVRRVGEPPEAAHNTPSTGSPARPSSAPPLRLVPVRANVCDRCGQRASVTDYVDRVFIDGVEQLRHVICPQPRATDG